MLTDWQYYKKITISGSSGAGTNYQVLLKIGESSSSSGYDFHLHGHSAKFPFGKNESGDLRFTAGDGQTLLNFWVEKVEGSSPNRVAYIWIKVFANLDIDQTIYCYYGNPNATNASDGEATLDFFDDFEDISQHEIYQGTNDWAVGGIEMPDGTIIAAWEHNTSETSNDGIIRASKSVDGGVTWDIPYILQDTSNLRDAEPQFFVDGNTVFFFYSTIDESDSNRPSHIYYKTSTDNGATWSGATEIASYSYIKMTIQNPIKKQYSPNAGRIILPIYYYDTDAGYYRPSILYSDDNGNTWQQGGTASSSDTHYYAEPTIVELSNGNLLMYIRSEDGQYIYKSVSSDGGATWSDITATSLDSPVAQSVLLRLANGHYVLLWNNVSSSSNTPRIPLTVAISTDDCSTWSSKVNIRSGSGQFNNMGLMQKSNGDIIALYSDEINQKIISAIFTEDSIMRFSNKWETIGNPDIFLSNSVLTMTCDAEEYIESKLFTQSSPAILETKSRDKDYGSYNYPATYGFGKYHNTTYDTNGIRREIYTNAQYCLMVDDNSGRNFTAAIDRDTNYAKYKIEWTSSICHIYKDGVKEDSDEVTTHIPTEAVKINIGRTYYQGEGNTFDIDYILVRKYANPEPTFLSAGTEGANANALFFGTNF